MNTRRLLAAASSVLALSLTLAAAVLAEPTTQPTTRPAAAAYPLTKCVVSGETFGENGEKPIVATIEGREVRFCCPDCEKEFKADTAKWQKKMDEQVVETQKRTYTLMTCPVSDEKLGGGDMGEPVMYVYRPTNQLVEFCCKGCVKRFEKDPAKYLAKVDEAGK